MSKRNRNNPYQIQEGDGSLQVQGRLTYPYGSFVSPGTIRYPAGGPSTAVDGALGRPFGNNPLASASKPPTPAQMPPSFLGSPTLGRVFSNMWANITHTSYPGVNNPQAMPRVNAAGPNPQAMPRAAAGLAQNLDPVARLNAEYGIQANNMQRSSYIPQTADSVAKSVLAQIGTGAQTIVVSDKHFAFVETNPAEAINNGWSYDPMTKMWSHANDATIGGGGGPGSNGGGPQWAGYTWRDISAGGQPGSAFIAKQTDRGPANFGNGNKWRVDTVKDANGNWVKVTLPTGRRGPK